MTLVEISFKSIKMPSTIPFFLTRAYALVNSTHNLRNYIMHRRLKTRCAQ